MAHLHFPSAQEELLLLAWRKLLGGPRGLWPTSSVLGSAEARPDATLEGLADARARSQAWASIPWLQLHPDCMGRVGWEAAGCLYLAKDPG